VVHNLIVVKYVELKVHVLYIFWINKVFGTISLTPKLGRLKIVNLISVEISGDEMLL